MKSKDREDILDEIRAASKFGYAENVSIVDKLLNAHWCTEDDLLLAYEDLQKPGQDRVIIFFQVPFIVRLPDKWLRITSEYGNPYVRFTQASSDVKQKSPSLLSNFYGKLGRTQVMISYQLWEIRRQRYIPYLEALNTAQAFVNTKLTSRGVLNAGTFELDVAKRLLLQTGEIVKEFIPVYRVTCKDPFAHIPERLDNYFMMVKTGRVVIRDLSESTNFKDTHSHGSQEYAKNLTALRRRLKLDRRPSIYETYLLEAARQIELGAANLAVVQTVMILDWFANEIIEDHLFGEIKRSFPHKPEMYKLAFERMWENEKNKHIRIGTGEKFEKYLPAIGVTLNSDLLGGLRKLIDLRDEIVHRKQVDPIENNVAEDIVDVGMNIIRHCMDSLLTRKKS